MEPYDFSVKNALEILSDDIRRKLTTEARECAEAGKEIKFDFKGTNQPTTYWDEVVAEHKRIIWMDAYLKRRYRMERIKQSGNKRPT